MSRKILYIFDAGDWESRMEVAHKAQEKGYDLTIGLITTDQNAAHKNCDIPVYLLQKKSTKIGILSTLKFIADIQSLIRTQRPDIIHVVTLKYSFMTGIAALPFAKIRKIFTLAGLGYLFRSDAQKSKILCSILSPFFKMVFHRPHTHLIFQNRDDQNLLIDNGFVKQQKTSLIKGSGVYLDRFHPGNQKHENPPIVLMPTRLVHDKGISVFIEAARILKQRGIDARFRIAGGETRHNPRSITKEEMQDMIKDGSVEWLGRVNDLPQRLASAALIVYPSHYGEGIPRVLLESCAAGKAIITTDHPGCREAVDHEENGLLVPVKNSQATADAIETLLADPNRIQSMQVKSRQKAEKEFDIHLIAEKTISLYETM